MAETKLTKEERELVAMYRKLKDADKRGIMDLIRGWVSVTKAA